MPLPQDEHRLKPHATHTGPRARQQLGDTSVEMAVGCLLPQDKRGDQPKPCQLLGDPQGWGWGRAAAARQELLSAQGWGGHMDLHQPDKRSSLPLQCHWQRWKKCPTILSNTTVTLVSPTVTTCSSHQKTTICNPLNTCCNSSAPNKVVRNTWVQCSGLFLLHSCGHHAPQWCTSPAQAERL